MTTKALKDLTKEELEHLLKNLLGEKAIMMEKKLNLNMARGKPSKEQLDLSLQMLDCLDSYHEFSYEDEDYRNYGASNGIYELRCIFSKIFGSDPDEIIVGSNSSLSLMFDTVAAGMETGFNGQTPWNKLDEVKFLCPVPGYDRHFSICEYFGIKMINVKMDENGPCMDEVEKLVSEDESIKGIWCVPKYSNPSGIVYSDETVKRFAKLNPKAKDFKILWDNAYAVHTIGKKEDNLLCLFNECLKNDTAERLVQFTSYSKITFPAGGVAALAAFGDTLKTIKTRRSFMTIGPDKLNQLRHYLFLPSIESVKEHMKRHAEILDPKFHAVSNALEPLKENGLLEYTHPNGGYFISVNLLEGTAKKTVALCKEMGVVLTGAGATYPYKNDPKDSNIRIAPSYPPLHELSEAMEVFKIACKIACAEKLINDMN